MALSRYIVNETRQSKVMTSDVIAQRSEYAADINDLKASIDTTRRALDPEVLGANVADNIDEVMGESMQSFVKGIQLNLDAAQANQTAANKTSNATQTLTDKLSNLDMQANRLMSVATRLEERDSRSKWDWVTLGCAMLVAAGLAGAGAVYYTKQNLDTANFADAIQLIQNDNDAYWCGSANAHIVQDNDGTHYCAVQMPKYQVPEPAE